VRAKPDFNNNIQSPGEIMIDLYYWMTPNGHKIPIFLEEAELPYIIHPINISKGDQFQPAFLQISTNNRIPAIIDQQYYNTWRKKQVSSCQPISGVA
jgi:hypothetical protein